MTLRSARWFGGADLAGFIHRASIHAEGISRSALGGRPVIGICNSWSELVNCNLHFRALAESVKRGELLAGGLTLEFPDDLARREPDEAERHALPEPDVDGRRGVHSRLSARRRRPARGLRQDRPPVGAGVVSGQAARRGHRPLALRRRAPGRADERGGF
jgi:hypothetical protein